MPVSKEIIQQCQCGNRQSLEQLYKHYYQRVRSKVIKTLGYYHLAIDDVVQNIFIEIFKSIKNFRHDSSLDTWIFRITINIAYQEMRKNYKTSKLEDDIENAVNIHSFFGAEQIENSIFAKNILQRVQLLPPKIRIAFTLFFFEGHTLQEISDMLGEPLQTINSRIKNGKEQVLLHIESVDSRAFHENHFLQALV